MGTWRLMNFPLNFRFLPTSDNRNTGKFDFIVYPQFAFRNTTLEKLYEVQLNVAPAIEFSIWKGMNFTGQVIFPVINELGYEGGFIRPGYVTLSQDFRLPKQWFGKASMGNFSDTRYGIDFTMKHPFRNENWNLDLNIGLTGSSHFIDSRWTRTNLNTVTWASSVSYYYPHLNLRFKAGAAELGYDAGTEFLQGQTYGTRPDQNRINDNNFPEYIKNEIIQPLK